MLFAINPATVSARPIWETPEASLMSRQLVFIGARDLYRLAYWGFPAGADSSRLNFWSSDNTYYSLDSSNIPSGSYYLTCNGRYILELFDGGVKVAETSIIVTTKIESPTCQSYSNPDQLKNDMGLNDNGGGTNADGSMTLSWNAVSGATKYEVYKDGVKVGETTGTSYDINSSGAYTVNAVGGNGDLLGESDYNAPNPFPSANGGGQNGGCNGCQWITDALACPAWDEYMGEFTNAIRAAMPPPTNWNQVAGIMRDTIVPAMGQELVNRAPELAEIFADEFTSREKPVAPPSPKPTPYNPPGGLPNIYDLPQKIDTNLSQNVPDFTPDESGSEPFIIPDPLDLELDDQDAGYVYPAQTDPPTPTYNPPNQSPEIEPDKGYEITNPTNSAPMPTYNSGGTSGGDPLPSYSPSGGGGGAAPDYKSNVNDDPIYYNGGGG